MIQRLLIANRGEIAVRIARGARELGIVPLGIYSEADADAMHVSVMDEAICIGPAPAPQSYLNIEAIIAAARTMRADAVHPGYGFLSERAPFAQAVLDAGMIFVGPSPHAMSAMGSKREAKMRVREFDVPVIEGYEGEEQSPQRLQKEAARIGTPLLIKASAGGGGRGMRVVSSLTQFEEALQSAQREAQAAFGDSSVLLERYLGNPRHIEFQVLADNHGNVVHLGERECSIQRRHQKIIEEAPSVAVSAELRAKMGDAAVRAAKSVNYSNAGTVEFMLDSDGRFYFLEMNTRLQVEHPVTELVYGVDLVHWQLRVASGEKLTLQQDALTPRGWAIESRIYAEDPYNQMLPSTGRITQWQAPQTLAMRLDSGVRSGSEVSVYYDPMLAKLIVWGEDRSVAVTRMRDALDHLEVRGVRTNRPLLQALFADPQVQQGDFSTKFLDAWLQQHPFERERVGATQLAAAVAQRLSAGEFAWRIGSVGIPFRFTDGHQTYSVTASQVQPNRWELSGDASGRLEISQGDVKLDGKRLENESADLQLAPPPSLQGAGAHAAGASGEITAPMPGKIVKISVASGQEVAERALLMVLEAMKMEHRIEAPAAGKVQAIHVREGDVVAGAAPLLDLA